MNQSIRIFQYNKWGALFGIVNISYQDELCIIHHKRSHLFEWEGIHLKGDFIS